MAKNFASTFLYSKYDQYEKETIDTVLASYGDMEPYELRAQTHAEDPWKNARGNLDDMASCTNVITKNAMGEYYGSL